MNTKLITALRTSAKAIENETFRYDWYESQSCNCGVVVCALLGKSSVELRKEIPDSVISKTATWTDLVGEYCPITGTPANDLFKKLMSFGLTSKDIVDLEYLRNPDVISRISLPEIPGKKTWYGTRSKSSKQKINYESPKHLVIYLRAWASLLEEKGSLDVMTASNSNALIKSHD